MDGFGLAKKQQRPSDTFCAGENPRDQLENLANLGSSIGRKMQTFPPVINERVNRKPMRV